MIQNFSDQINIWPGHVDFIFVELIGLSVQFT